MATYLNSEGPITEIEEAETETSGGPRLDVDHSGAPVEQTRATPYPFTVGSLKGQGGA
jgi:hypothetical protein